MQADDTRFEKTGEGGRTIYPLVSSDRVHCDIEGSPETPRHRVSSAVLS